MRLDRAAAKSRAWRGSSLHATRETWPSRWALAVLIGLAIVCQMFIPSWGSAANRIVEAWDFVPSTGAVNTGRLAGPYGVLVGSSLEIVAKSGIPTRRPSGRRFS